jgi:hypothetical protein
MLGNCSFNLLCQLSFLTDANTPKDRLFAMQSTSALSTNSTIYVTVLFLKSFVCHSPYVYPPFVLIYVANSVLHISKLDFRESPDIQVYHITQSQAKAQITANLQPSA